MTFAPDELSKLEEIAKAATQGEWKAGLLRSQSLEQDDHDRTFINERYHATGPGHSADDEDSFDEMAIADSKFIAAFNPAVALKLIAELRAKTALLERAKTGIRYAYKHLESMDNYSIISGARQELNEILYILESEKPDAAGRAE